jgi:hypothetical protein
MNAFDQQDERDAVDNTGGEITAAVSATTATEEDEEKALFKEAAPDTEDRNMSAQEEQSPAVDPEAGVLPPENATRVPPENATRVQEPPREESLSLAAPAASGEDRRSERAADRRRRQRNNDDPASNKAAYFKPQCSSSTDAPSNLTEDLLSPDDQGVNDEISENFALLQGHMTPVRSGALVVSAASAPTSVAATSKSAPEPLASSHTRPGAYTAYTRALGDQPAWNQANEVMVQAELVPSQPSGGGDETGEAPFTTSLEIDQAPVVEVNPAVIAVAAPIDTKRKYYYMAGVLLLVTAFATVLGVVRSGPEEDESDNYLPPLSDTVLATVPATICYERNPEAGWSRECPTSATSEQGGGATNLVAQACLERFPNAHMVIHSAGMVHDDIVKGTFTYGDLELLLPNNEDKLVLLNMTGSDIELVLEQALDFIEFVQPNAPSTRAYAKPKPPSTGAKGKPKEPSTGAYPYAAGLKFAVNMTAEFGKRLSDMQVKEREKDTWKSLDFSDVYAVVANSYIAGGQDGYCFFGEISEKMKDTNRTTSEIFYSYAVAQDELSDPPPEDYSTISYIPP